MSWLDALWQGILQGISEFLPISSSGHLSLYQHFTGNSGEGALMFTLILHLGTLVAVIAYYYQDVWGIIREFFLSLADLFRGKFTFRTNNPHRRLMFMLILATLPLGLMLLLKDFVGGLAEDKDIIVEGIGFLITSALLFVACNMKQGKTKAEKMNPRQALGVGFVQVVATIPGISRSGSTTSAGMIFGLEKELAIKFSFLLGIPAILGSSVFEISDAVQQGVKLEFAVVAIGMASAAIAGYLSIWLFRMLIQRDLYSIFAWYMLALGVVVVALGIGEHLFGIYLFSAGPPEPLVTAGWLLGR